MCPVSCPVITVFITTFNASTIVTNFDKRITQVCLNSKVTDKLCFWLVNVITMVRGQRGPSIPFIARSIILKLTLANRGPQEPQHKQVEKPSN